MNYKSNYTDFARNLERINIRKKDKHMNAGGEFDVYKACKPYAELKLNDQRNFQTALQMWDTHHR